MSESTTSFYYDIANASLIIGESGFNDAVNSGVHAADIIPLEHALLTNEVIALKAGSNCVEQVNINGSRQEFETPSFSHQDRVSYISWLGNTVLGSSAQQQRLTDDVLTRACQLGLGPSLKHIRGHGDLSQLYVEAGVANTHRRGLWDS